MIKYLTGPVALLWMLVTIQQTTAQRLDLFTSHGAGKVPYSKTCGFYDFINEGNPADTVIEGKNCYYIYFEVPFELNEIGVRLISPVPSYVFPHAGDKVTSLYESNKNSTLYFNPALVLEKRITNDTSGQALPVPKWEILARNDNSEDVISQPTGERTNSLVRIYHEPYTAGIYRVVIRSMGKGNAEGSYLLQIGTEPGVKRLKISRTPGGLAETE